MSETTGTPSLHDLLRRGAWARRLAQSLVRDGEAVDDLLQDAWVVAARKAPAEWSPGWLVGVLRVLGLGHARAAHRRRQRETEAVRNATALLGDVPRADDVLETVETQKQLGEALLALPEPYRTTVALRYYEELSSAEIARRMNVPAGTVRWRIKEGLTRLRRQLSERAGGERASLIALARFAASGPPKSLSPMGAGVCLATVTLGLAAAVLYRHRAPSAVPHPGPSAIQTTARNRPQDMSAKENTMKNLTGIIAVAAGLAAHPDPTSVLAQPAIPSSKVPRFWVPLGVGPVKGPPTAKVTVVAFMDYESPFCLQASQTIDAVMAAHPGEVRYQVIHRPLPFHRRAPFAAKAALAAGQQGRFWEMHAVLLANQAALEARDIEGYAKKLGLDVARFKADLVSPTVTNQVDLEDANASSLKVAAIPSFFLNGRSVQGAQPRAVFEKFLAEELGYASAVLRAGVKPADLYNTITKLGSSELKQTEASESIPQAEPGAGPTNSVFHAAHKILTETVKAKDCYESALAIKPGLTGQVVVDLRLVPGKEPTILLHESTMKFAKVDNCIVQALKTLSYPKVEGDAGVVVVRHAFTFPSETVSGRL